MTQAEWTSKHHAAYVRRLADAPLVLGQRISELIGWAPTLEEEIALANIALDLIGQATPLYERSAELMSDGRTADDEAYLRSDREFHNPLIVERPNSDFAHTIVRLLLVTAYALPLWQLLGAQSQDETVRGVALKAVKESSYHLRHAASWSERLGGGTVESRERMTQALVQLWPYVAELTKDDALDIAADAEGVGVLPSKVRGDGDALLAEVLRRAQIDRPHDVVAQVGGRQGIHTEALGYLLGEMQSVRRAHPGAVW